MCLSFFLLVYKFHCWFEGSKNKKFFVKPSFVYKINYSVMTTFVFYFKDKLLCHKTISYPVFKYMCVHMCTMNLHIHGMCMFSFVFSL